ncbi:hypothetical protein VTN02DRAFT_5810 [Thermoascus thermophilus]
MKPSTCSLLSLADRQTDKRDAVRTEQESDCPRTRNLAVFPNSGLDAYRPQFGQAGSPGDRTLEGHMLSSSTGGNRTAQRTDRRYLKTARESKRQRDRAKERDRQMGAQSRDWMVGMLDRSLWRPRVQTLPAALFVTPAPGSLPGTPPFRHNILDSSTLPRHLSLWTGPSTAPRPKKRNPAELRRQRSRTTSGTVVQCAVRGGRRRRGFLSSNYEVPKEVYYEKTSMDGVRRTTPFKRGLWIDKRHIR